MTAPQIWPAESTSKGRSSFFDSLKEHKASIGGGTVSHAEKSSVLGISMVREGFGILRE